MFSQIIRGVLKGHIKIIFNLCYPIERVELKYQVKYKYCTAQCISNFMFFFKFIVDDCFLFQYCRLKVSEDSIAAVIAIHLIIKLNVFI